MHRRAQESAEDLNAAPGAGETIAAISTPAGEGAIALVRLSGTEAIAIADAIFRGKEKPSQFESHVQHYGEIAAAEAEARGLVDGMGQLNHERGGRVRTGGAGEAGNGRLPRRGDEARVGGSGGGADAPLKTVLRIGS